MNAPMRQEPAPQQGSWDKITGALELAVGPGRPAGSWTKYRCPSHEADGRHHTPSLGIKYDVRQQRTVVKCFGPPCDDVAVLASLGLEVRDMFDRAPERGRDGRRSVQRSRPREISRADRAIDAAGLPLTKPRKDLGRQLSPWKQVTSYPYARADGTVAGEVIRKEATFERGRDKKFSQRRWTDNGWEAEGFEPIPFQLPRVLDAIDAGGLIAVCEGEKDVLSAEAAGLTATCNAGGAGAWKPEHAQWLKGARLVVIVADLDAPGFRRAEKVANSLTGLVERVRIVAAATGKDLTDHLQAGHEISDLRPVPHLDPYTPGAPAPPTPSATGAAPATNPGTEPLAGDPSMPDYMLAPSLHDGPADTTPDIDHMGNHWSRFMQLLMGQMLAYAQKAALARKAAAETLAAQSREQQRADAERLAAEQHAIETRLEKMRKAGWDNATRSQIAAAVRDSATWAADSQVAKNALDELTGHVHTRWGLRLDQTSGEVHAEVPPQLADALAAAETERAASWRLRTATNRMVEAVAGHPALDESTRQGLFAEIEAWRANPTGKQLSTLTQKLTDNKVDERTRTRIRFIAGYLGPDVTLPLDQLGTVAAVAPTAELRRMPEPLVDPGEEVKPRVDQLLVKYQDRLRHGVDTTTIREQLAAAVAVMTPEDQQQARDRGRAIRDNPAAVTKPLWPEHVDRDELAGAVRTYAALAPQAERQAVAADDLDAVTAAQLREHAAKHRRTIDHALKNGKGLHDLERDQIKAVLDDVDAGVQVVPELLFADDRSAAALDADRADGIAATTSQIHRRQLTELLTGTVPPEVVRRNEDEITRVFHAQTQLAGGRWNLGEYEQRGVEARLDTALTGAGVPEPVRNRVRHHLDYAAGECAIAGKQALRIADRWTERTDAVAASRAPAPPSYDSPERREQMAEGLADAGLTPDQVAQRMAADATRAHPPATAVAEKPGRNGSQRSTSPGSGVHRINHRGRGDQRGYGR
ncbi:toprim domain-containing protein [Nocardia sp. NPDC051756]|uniref:toprim domain-containing protein n=1 Tax=Nocardia sp. NPDC051756 TaxID=3154751 RepID=UPI0034303F18